MALVIEMTPEAEALLRAEWGDLNRAAHEALVIESYRQGKLSLGQCGSLLGLSVLETEAFFRDRRVVLGLTLEDVHDDAACLKGISVGIATMMLANRLQAVHRDLASYSGQHLRPEERIEFTGELPQIFARTEIDTWEDEDVHPDIRVAMRHVGIDITEPEQYKDDPDA